VISSVLTRLEVNMNKFASRVDLSMIRHIKVSSFSGATIFIDRRGMEDAEAIIRMACGATSAPRR
jgi:hypothetical protein